MLNPKNLFELYSGDDLAVLFKGGFINFGYWDHSIVNKQEISIEDVVSANKNLYQQIFDQLNINENDIILEVGSGHGAGCNLVYKHYNPKKVIGLDFFQSHVDLSKARYKSFFDEENLFYLQGRAESIPLPSQFIDKLYTLEAFQHFQVNEAIAEFSRVLKQNGTLIISTFFTKDKKHFPELLKLLPRTAILADEGDEKDAALPEVLKLLENNSFDKIQVYSIGNHVWEGYDKWVKQSACGIWDSHWLIAYQKGLLDYFFIKATRM